jgi:hypothetical protein
VSDDLTRFRCKFCDNELVVLRDERVIRLAPLKWNYEDVIISLHGPGLTKVSAYEADSATADAQILEAVRQRATTGWEPDEPANFRWLVEHRRCRITDFGASWWKGGPYRCTYHSVTLRFRRASST